MILWCRAKNNLVSALVYDRVRKMNRLQGPEAEYVHHCKHQVIH
jgi:hypothetical protein